jgi:nitroreductase
MNEVINNIKSRRSTKKFKSEMIPAEIIKEIVEASTYAPTGRNRQSPQIIVVTDKNLRDRLSAMNARILGVDFDPFYGAPVVVIVVADKTIPTCVYDGSSVMTTMMLAAHSLKIGSCWIHRAKEEFESDEGKSILAELGIEGEFEGIGHCVLGYSDEAPKTAPPRKENYIVYK